jgi:hypothetical protein
MARTNVVAQTLSGSYPALPVTSGTDLAEQAATGSGGSSGQYTALVSGKTCVLAHNTDGGAPHGVAFTSVADAQNRTGDINPGAVYSLAAATIHIFGPFQSTGWTNGGQLWFEADSASVKFAVLTLP